MHISRITVENTCNQLLSMFFCRWMSGHTYQLYVLLHRRASSTSHMQPWTTKAILVQQHATVLLG